MIFAVVAAGLAMASCNGKKAEQAAPATTLQEDSTPVDTAFLNKAVGEYKSYDGSKSITLNADFTVTTKNDKDFYKWDIAMEPQNDMAAITLFRKGADKDIEAQAQLDLVEEALTIKNETYRKGTK